VYFYVLVVVEREGVLGSSSFVIVIFRNNDGNAAIIDIMPIISASKVMSLFNIANRDNVNVG